MNNLAEEPSSQITIEKIDNLIRNLEKAMDESSISNTNAFAEKMTGLPATYKIPIEVPQMLFNEIWIGFLRHCEQNGLDPAQQIKEAAASYYQDLLKIYRVRSMLALEDRSNLV